MEIETDASAQWWIRSSKNLSFGPRSVPLDYKYCPAREGLAIMICCCVVVDVAIVVIAVVIIAVACSFGCVASSLLSSKI